MTIAGQIQEAANRLADSKAKEILGLAFENLSRRRSVKNPANRFELLRKQKTEPSNDIEAKYIEMLHLYVLEKILLSRLKRNAWLTFGEKDRDILTKIRNTETRMRYFRNNMDEIELAGSYSTAKDLH